MPPAGKHRPLTGADAILSRFLESESLEALQDDGPIAFDKAESFKSLLCCAGVAGAAASGGLGAVLCPVGTFCPSTMFQDYHLTVRRTLLQPPGYLACSYPAERCVPPPQLDHDAVQYGSATNDFCFHGR
jgi:hypothetical protein